jgi:hypothetical protein
MFKNMCTKCTQSRERRNIFAPYSNGYYLHSTIVKYLFFCYGLYSFEYEKPDLKNWIKA